ncbi:hypothetical protein EXIGLDRAFT_728173 [Exidia glandulosa HHB12029]|uniref:F-box domain-containing protein n=1 Tax=Exidia glandulosa HHB12029 TaxID=1314781 RepID=A0A165D1N5_EXIGL|nr:hypothetical protein EXIGLDRAFT_728173 [Exidia glandulosa HHB12029]
MDRLPPEVIANILLYACHSSPTKSDVYDLRPQIQCSHICRYWRDVALGTPSLWATIVISDTESLSRPSYFALLDLAWARIGSTAPLSLIVSLYPRNEKGGAFRSLFTRVVFVLQRVSELDLSMPEPGSWNANELAPLKEGRNLPILRRLVLDFTGIDIVCPQLRVASFEGCLTRLRPVGASYSFDFPLLEDLTLSNLAISVREIHRILSGAAFLERLAIERVIVSADPRLEVLDRMPSHFLATEMDLNSVLAVLRLAAPDTVLAEVSYTEPRQAWAFFSQLPELLSLDPLSTICRIRVDGKGPYLTLWDDAGRRRFVRLPKDTEAMWNMLADRKGIFDTVEEWELGANFLSVWSVAIARGGFTGAKLVTFEDQSTLSLLEPEPGLSVVTEGHLSPPPRSIQQVYSLLREQRQSRPASPPRVGTIIICAWPQLRELRIVPGKDASLPPMQLLSPVLRAMTAPSLETVQVPGGDYATEHELHEEFPELRHVSVVGM